FTVHPMSKYMLGAPGCSRHRTPHMRALPWAPPPVESGQHARGGEYAGKVVRLGFRWPAWRQGRIARDIQETAFGQCDEIVTSEIFLWPGLAKSGDRRYDDARIDRRKTLVPQPFRLHFTGLKTFQPAVRSLHQFAKYVAIRFFVEIEHLARLAGVEMRKCRAQLRAICRRNKRR